MDKKSPYQHVIYRAQDDKEHANLVNSLRFRSSTGNKYKKWSPDISTEERYKKKRLREEKYAENLPNKEKPILLIQKKHVFQNLKDPEIFKGDAKSASDYLKISKNTEVIPDIHNAIEAHSPGIRKNTYIHNAHASNADPFSLNSIFKIQGIEFLPEGFLELEPLLYKDEYDFENKHHEEIFEKEQRKMKEMRRKQYTQKEHQKKRDVTILLVDQYKDHLTDYLEEWYTRYNRRLTKEEIDQVSKILNTDPQSFSDLQDTYLKKKKILNAHKLKEFLMAEEDVRNDRINSLPDHIKKYFIGRSGNQSSAKQRTAKSSPHFVKPKEIQSLVDNYDLDEAANHKNSINNSRNPSKLSTHQQTPLGEKQSLAQSLRNPSKVSTQQNLPLIPKTSNANDYNNPSRTSAHRSTRNPSNVQGGDLIDDTNTRHPSQKQSIASVKNPSQSGLQKDSVANGSRNPTLSKTSGAMGNRETISNSNYNKNPSRSGSQASDNIHNKGSADDDPTSQPPKHRISKDLKYVANLDGINYGDAERLPGGRDIELYFDTEINTILDRIRTSTYSEKNRLSGSHRKPSQDLKNRTTSSASKGKLSGQKSSHQPSKTTNLIEEVAHEVMSRHNTKQNERPKAETVNRSNSKSRPNTESKASNSDFEQRSIRISSQLAKYNADPFNYKGRANAELNENRSPRISSQLKLYNKDPQNYRTPALNVLGMDNEEIEIFTRVDTHGRGKDTADFVLPSNKDSRDQSENINYSLSLKKSGFLPLENFNNEADDHRRSTNRNTAEEPRQRKSTIANKASGVYANIPEPTRITIVSTNQRGESVVSQKLRPTLVGNHYYYQIIDDLVDSSGKRKTFVTVKNEEGKIVAQHPIKLSQLGSFHHSVVVYDDANEKRKSQAFLLVRNENGDTVAVTNIPLIEESNAKSQSVAAIFGPQGDRRSTVVIKQAGDEQTITHSLKPMVIGNEFYRQTITQVNDPNKKSLVVTMINESGEVISVNKVSPDLAGLSYVSYVAEESIDKNNIRKSTVRTFNNEGKLVLQQSFTTPMESLLNDYKAVSLLEEVENEKGQRTLTIVEKLPSSKSISVQKQIRPSILGDEYYIEVLENPADNSGKKSIALAARKTLGNKLLAQSNASLKHGVIAEEHLTELQRKAEEELARDLSKKQSILLRPMTEQYTVEILEDKPIDREGHRSILVSVVDVRGNTIAKKSFRVANATDIGNEHFAEILNEIEDELDAKRKSSIAKKSFLGNRVSQNLRRSKLVSINERDPQAHPSLTDKSRSFLENKANQSDHDDPKNYRKSTSPQPETFESQNKYYNRLLEDLKNSGDHRGSLPTQNASRNSNLNNIQKSHTINNAYPQEENNQHRSSSNTSAQRFDRNKTTVDVKNELAKEQSIFKRPSSQVRPSQPSALRDHSPVPSFASKGDLAEHQVLTPKTSLKSASHNNSVVLSQFQKPSLIDKITSDRNSKVGSYRESKSPARETHHKSTTLTPKESIANTFRESIQDSHHIRPTTSHNLQGSTHNQRGSDIHSLREDHNLHDSNEKNSLRQSIQKHTRVAQNAEPHHDSFNPNNSLDNQTRNLIQKSQALKGYLDDYIDTLQKSPGHAKHEVSRQPVHEHKNKNFAKDKDPSIVSSAQPEIAKPKPSQSDRHSSPFSPSEQRNLKEKIKEVYDQEKEKLSEEVLERVKQKIAQDSNHGTNLLDEFYRFCEHELPHDKRYKDSMLLVSMFYYFLEKKDLIK